MRTHKEYMVAYVREVEDLIQQQLEELYTGRVVVRHRGNHTITVSKILPPAERPEPRRKVKMRMHTGSFMPEV